MISMYYAKDDCLCYSVKLSRLYTTRHLRLLVLNALILIVLGWNNGKYFSRLSYIFTAHHHSAYELLCFFKFS